MPLGLACPAGFTASTSASGPEVCFDSAGYTANSRQCTHEAAVRSCAGDVPLYAVLAAGALFLPGWWKVIPVAWGVAQWGLSEFGGPSCPSLLMGRARPVPGFPCGG